MEKLLKYLLISLMILTPVIFIVVIIILLVINKDNVKYNEPFHLQDIITDKYLGSDGTSSTCTITDQNGKPITVNIVNINSDSLNNNKNQTWLFESVDNNSIGNGFTHLLENINIKKYIDICDDQHTALNNKNVINSDDKIPSITQLWTINVYEKKNDTYQKKDQKYIKFGDIVQFVNNSNSTVLSVDDTTVKSTKMLRVGDTPKTTINKYFKVLKPK